MTDAPAFDYARYPAPGGDEWMILRGPRAGPRVLVLAPILNEANQCRAMVVELARQLAAAGVRTAIPDLPGTGESRRPLAQVRWSEWREAAAAASGSLNHDGVGLVVASLRGGALLDDACTVTAGWRFAEASGASLLRPLERAQRLRDATRGPPAAAGAKLAGFTLHSEFVDALRAAVPAAVTHPVRMVAFDGANVPIWRKAEPTNDRTLAQRLAADLIAWMSACAA